MQDLVRGCSSQVSVLCGIEFRITKSTTPVSTRVYSGHFAHFKTRLKPDALNLNALLEPEAGQTPSTACRRGADTKRQCSEGYRRLSARLRSY